MTRTEGIAILDSCREKFWNHIDALIGNYSQYGVTLHHIELAIKWRDEKLLISHIADCYCPCRAEEADVHIVNFNGPLDCTLQSMLKYAKLLKKNRELKEKIS